MQKGTSILFINDRLEVLLLLRDNIPTIPYPNMWDLPGGHVEADETPEECIKREMAEEMGIDLENFHFFSAVAFSDRMEYVFWKQENLNIETICLTEGQKLRWFKESEIREMKLACCFNAVVEAFFREAPFVV